MTTPAPPPWDQQPNESSAAFRRFLVYLHMGPARSIPKAVQAWRAMCPPRNPNASPRNGQWQDDAARWSWIERAAAWDIFQLRQSVPEFAALVFANMTQMARLTLEAAQSGALKPTSWEELKDASVVLAQFVSPETIAAAVDHAGQPGLDPAGNDAARAAAADDVADADQPDV